MNRQAHPRNRIVKAVREGAINFEWIEIPQSTKKIVDAVIQITPLNIRYATLTEHEQYELTNHKLTSALAKADENSLTTGLHALLVVPISIQELISKDVITLVRDYSTKERMRHIVLAGTPNVAGQFPRLDLRGTQATYAHMGVKIGLLDIEEEHLAANTLVVGMSMIIPSKHNSHEAREKIKHIANTLGIPCLEPLNPEPWSARAAAAVNEKLRHSEDEHVEPPTSDFSDDDPSPPKH